MSLGGFVERRGLWLGGETTGQEVPIRDQLIITGHELAQNSADWYRA